MNNIELLKPSTIPEERQYLYYSYIPIEKITNKDLEEDNSNIVLIGYLNYYEYLDFRAKVKERYKEEVCSNLSGYFFYYKNVIIPIRCDGKFNKTQKGFYSMSVDLLCKLF